MNALGSLATGTIRFCDTSSSSLYGKDYLNKVLAKYHIELLDAEFDFEQLLDSE